jgi:hypothetical protein
LKLAVSKGNNRVGVSLPSPEEGHLSRLPDDVFQLLTIPDDEQRPHPGDSDRYASSPEPFTFRVVTIFTRRLILILSNDVVSTEEVIYLMIWPSTEPSAAIINQSNVVICIRLK